MLTKGQQNGKVRVSSKTKLLAEAEGAHRRLVGRVERPRLVARVHAVQGIELVNPAPTATRARAQTYFSKQAAFFAGGDAGKSYGRDV